MQQLSKEELAFIEKEFFDIVSITSSLSARNFSGHLCQSQFKFILQVVVMDI